MDSSMVAELLMEESLGLLPTPPPPPPPADSDERRHVGSTGQVAAEGSRSGPTTPTPSVGPHRSPLDASGTVDVNSSATCTSSDAGSAQGVSPAAGSAVSPAASTPEQPGVRKKRDKAQMYLVAIADRRNPHVRPCDSRVVDSVKWDSGGRLIVRETAKDEVAAYIHSITADPHLAAWKWKQVRDNWLTTKKGQPGFKFERQGARQDWSIGTLSADRKAQLQRWGCALTSPMEQAAASTAATTSIAHTCSPPGIPNERKIKRLAVLGLVF
jgi:hypothetical protein